ncbi:hypothetical protein RN001_015463 [Aquatica leii]|uniref:BTB domain-containing protein n=1 Tax=Aquatica leii TaxID=1421715 RepID=A0AAN7SDD2_9COLE|nr:hypothetical protein RN001_015463 [Aquatica leii]
MDEKYFESALSSLLKPQEPDRLCKILVVIRNNLEGSFGTIKENIIKIQEKGCVKDLVLCLQQRKIYIVNLTLSILSRCCMERNFARLAVNRHGLLSNLNSVLKRNEINSIRIRIFRVLGNMCEPWDRLANTIVEKEPQLHLVLKIVEFLKTIEHLDLTMPVSLEVETSITMAIRVLRELGHKETVGRLIDLGALKVVGVVLNKFAPIWIDGKTHQELLLAVLKFMYHYSKYRSPKFISELQDVPGENAMTHIGKMIVLNPFLVLKIMINLIYVTKSRSDLPFDVMSKCLIEKLQAVDTFTNGNEDKLFREYLKCLCFFVKHPAIRAIIHNAELIPALLAILKNLDNPSDITIKNCTMILSMFNMYMLDDALLSIMLENGVTSILVRKLEWLLGDSSDFDLTHEYKSKNGRALRNPHGLPKCLKSFDVESVFEMKNPSLSLRRSYSCDMIFERTTSPCSDISFSSGSLSPLSSPTMSEAEVSESDSDDYSPVCSDAECDITFQEDFDATCSPHDDIIERTSLGSNGTVDNSTKTLKKDLAIEIVKLVKLFTLMRPVVMDLINPPELLIKLLMLCVPWNKQIRPADTLHYVSLISKTPEYLISLMQTNFIMKVAKMTEMTHDSSCCTCQDLYSTGKTILNKIVYLVERKCGKGDIAHQLYRGSMSVKRKIVPIIPYIVDNDRILNQLLKIGGGLDILLCLVQETSNLQSQSITSLSHLGKKLGIINPVICKNSNSVSITMPINISSYSIDDDCAEIVYLKLDDGSVVKADRDFLCEKSHYFHQLLSGTFKESHQKEVHLHNVSPDALKFLLLLMKFEIDNKKIHKIDVDLSVLLDVIILTDRYLMEDYCLCLTTSVQLFKFQPEAMSKIYQWSLESGTDILRIESVAYAVVADISDNSRYAMFKGLLELGHNEHFISDIRGLLDRYFT